MSGIRKRATVVTTVRELLEQQDLSPPCGSVLGDSNDKVNDIKPRLRRAGVIIYTRWHDTIYFGLGCDHSTHDLTDFGGGVKKDETGPGAALREFAEESLIFQSPDLSEIMDCICVHDCTNLVVFISTTTNPHDSAQVFDSAFSSWNCRKKVEVCGLVWIPMEYFRKLLTPKRGERHVLYYKVRHLLSNSQWMEHL
jgi:hypothetical protein